MVYSVYRDVPTVLVADEDPGQGGLWDPLISCI